MKQKKPNKDSIALQVLWENKLKELGFVDLEDFRFLEYPPRDIPETREEFLFRIYSPMFLMSYYFETEEERQIWRFHLQGMGIKRIQGLIETPIQTETIRKIIEQLTPAFKEYVEKKLREI